ncbi:hypothetical protein KXD40_008981 [Peronospora effusa]|uniref:RNase H type-1 domain-containing protein n=1 Tax=Peronospora effusa TaxID=542832 RepID=A0A3M6VRP8_9STRA|nr:hypothetical protein DD238_008168 [Peronospora effusa]RQM18781.1 hypothetical protein DD237_008252 [Peronospora effusa]UIZ25196.1 hypothetical protein KXD40_008981 [Peronospora effusa]CAI5701320.1 unnamed protein product [Peronospora effusa]
MYLDGGAREHSSGEGVLIVDATTESVIWIKEVIKPKGTSNGIKYFGLIEGSGHVRDSGLASDMHLEVRSDSQLVLDQVKGTKKAQNERMRTYKAWYGGN